MLRQLIGYTASLSLTATSAMAVPGQVTSNLNFRTGPGTQNSIVLTIPMNSAVEILDCNEAGSWCAVEYNAMTGFVSGQYLIETEPDTVAGFPRAYGVGEEAFVVLYEPQFSAWTDFRQLYALFAAEYRTNEEAEPVFGVIGLRADTASVSEDRTVVASNLTVNQLDFNTLDRDALGELAVGVGGLLPTEPFTLAEERILAGLANYQTVSNVAGMKADPPAILVSYGPTRLVQTDGPAIFAPVENTPGTEFVVNTNWDLLRVDEALWLRDGSTWLTAASLERPWVVADALPDALTGLPENGNWDEARAAQPPVAYDDGMPVFFYADRPTEIIIFDGSPEYEDVPGTDLRWASNTESDLFQLRTTGTYYYLISGRWFSASSLDGPWTFATPDLPPDFLRIPDDTPYYTVRASIPGTSEAKEARLRASIPELAEVTIGDIESPEVVYAGDPNFEPIESTEMAFATNTAAQVIQIGARYFLVADGIWFVSDSPHGPWEPATEIPDEIYTIPADSAMHNVTYVRVYETTPTTVTYGYTPGYFWTFLAWGAVIYGTGWWYRDWWGDNNYYYYGPGNYYPPAYYRPPPATYGGGTYYNPARGTYGRYGYAYGPYRGIEARSAYNPATGTFARGGRVYGPQGSRGFVAAANPRTGTRAVARGGESAYGKWGSAAVKHGSNYARVRAGEGAAGGKGVKWDSSRGSGFAVSGRRGNTYAGRNGDVYRNVGDSWQKWDPNGGWQDVQRPNREQLRQQSDTLRQQRQARQSGNTAAALRAGQRLGAGERVPNQVRRDATARSTANQRSHQVRQSSSSARSQSTQRALNQRYGTGSRASPQRTPTRSAPQRSHSSRSAGASRSRSGASRGGRSGGGRGGGGRRR